MKRDEYISLLEELWELSGIKKACEVCIGDALVGNHHAKREAHCEAT